MINLKLSRLVDRTPIKLTLSIMPDLHAGLTDYARLYEQTYGKEERIEDLIPAMLSNFIEGDRAFARSRTRS